MLIEYPYICTNYLLNNNIPIVICTGAAGTGKTMIACHEAIKKLQKEKSGINEYKDEVMEIEMNWNQTEIELKNQNLEYQKKIEGLEYQLNEIQILQNSNEI